MYRVCLFTLFFLVIHVIWSSSALGETNNWTLQNQKTSSSLVSLYLRDYPNSKIPEFKAITTVPAPIASVLAVLLDKDACEEWIYQCKKAMMVRELNTQEQIFYQINELALIKDRDILLHASLHFYNEGKKIIIALTAAPDFCKKPSSQEYKECEHINNSQYIRVTKAIGSYELKENGDSTQVTWQQHLEPGGFLPSWLIKSQFSALPIKTLTALHDIVQKQKYQQAVIQINQKNLQLTLFNKSFD
ncbi:MAG: START domain-containing protein [Cellvibrionaceae bacterium]